MTIQALALQLLQYVGVWSLDPALNTNETNQRGLQASDLVTVIVSINAAIQEIYEALVALSEKRLTPTIYPPATIAFTATQYSTTISGVTGYQSWMKGCTVQLSANDPVDNEITSATELFRPYLGVSGPVSGTVYCDAILLPANVKNVMEPVELPNVRRMTVASSREDFRFWNMSRHDDRPAIYNEGAYLTTNKTVGDPRVYIVEPLSDSTSQALPLYLRLNPMPMRAMFASFRARIKPPVFTVADIGSVGSEPLTVIPVDWHESILLPLALKRFTRHPSFDNEARNEIADQAKEARLLLASYRPQIATPDAQYQ